MGGRRALHTARLRTPHTGPDASARGRQAAHTRAYIQGCARVQDCENSLKSPHTKSISPPLALAVHGFYASADNVGDEDARATIRPSVLRMGDKVVETATFLDKLMETMREDSAAERTRIDAKFAELDAKFANVERALVAERSRNDTLRLWAIAVETERRAVFLALQSRATGSLLPPARRGEYTLRLLSGDAKNAALRHLGDWWGEDRWAVTKLLSDSKGGTYSAPAHPVFAPDVSVYDLLRVCKRSGKQASGWRAVSAYQAMIEDSAAAAARLPDSDLDLSETRDSLALFDEWHLDADELRRYNDMHHTQHTHHTPGARRCTELIKRPLRVVRRAP